MKRTKYIVSFSLILSFLVTGCLDFDVLRENPNDPVRVPPSLVFTQVTPAPESSFSGVYRFSQYHNYIAADLGVSPPVDYRFGSAGFNYGTLRDIDKMAEEAAAVNAPAYLILAKFLRAYYFIEMSRRMGDIPFSEAMKGAEIPQPKYDAQKSVYIQCLDWLEEANTELGNYINEHVNETIAGDIYFNGDLKQWQKAINAYTIRVLISLSKKAADPELKIKERFQNIVDNLSTHPLMTGLEDNMQLEHRDEDGFRGAYNPNEQIVVEGIVYADTYIDLLKTYRDPRLQKVAAPTPKALEQNPDINEVAADFDSYNGSDISIDLEENNAQKSNGEFSSPNKERFLNFTGQPSVLIGYWEQELAIAEAANRGWISVDAKEHYDNGVGSSMMFYGIGQDDIDEYLVNNAPYQPGAEGLKRIHEQMYLAFAENSGWESWFLTRRTGVPVYKFSSVNNVDKLPVRWAYPTSEDTDNHENYRTALMNQFGAEVDDRDQLIWLLR